MKYVVMLGDGMADLPIPELEGKTPLEAAHIPNMDYLAKNGTLGLVKTVPDGMHPASDIANLSVLGYNPHEYYSGRSPLEAVSMGLSLDEHDVAFRCNFVTLSENCDLNDAVMIDYSAGEISTEEAAELISFLREKLIKEHFNYNFHKGISYRHCLLFKNSEIGTETTPPHDISGKVVGQYLPTGVNGEILLNLIKQSRDILKDHPINIKRVENGLNPANSCWFWGEGRKPSLTSFIEKFGVSGGVISAVDLIKGIAICAGLKSIDVPGATGQLHTNYRGKGEAALSFLNESDFIFIHVEAPDECGHRRDRTGKIEAIEKIDSEVLGVVLKGLEEKGEDFSILLLPDHPTPISLATHTNDPVPFAIFRSNDKKSQNFCFSEGNAQKTGIFVPEGYKLMEKFLAK